MQQLFANIAPITWYFAMGAPEKTSLSIQYCRENGLEYFNNPTVEQLRSCQKHTIIEGSYDLFQQLEKIMPELNLIYFGKEFENDKERRLRKEYLSIGYCKDVPVLDYPSCRKALYPNLILVYGPIQEQNYAAATTLAHNLSYKYGQLPPDPNNLIISSDKTYNYVINGLFTDPNHIKILDEYFNIKIIHFKYNRQDLPKHSRYFDEEHDLINFLKDKNYYYQIKGDDDPVLIMDNVGIKLCPRLIYASYDKDDQESVQYVKQYVKDTDGMILSIYNIQHIRKRKGLPIPKNYQGKTERINQILYKDLNRKQIILIDFPWFTTQFINLQNYNRKISYYVDLIRPQKYKYSKDYSSPIYYLEQQVRIAPSFELTMKEELDHQVEYWVVNGPGTCGKTSVAKYVAAEFGFKLVEFQAEAAAAKEKIAKPEDGEEVPAHRYVTYFGNMIRSNPGTIYIFDSLPYNNADLQLWISGIGCPNIINLKADPNQLIKRMRKKAQGDVNAEITQQQTAKVNENMQKNNEWIQKVGEFGPSSKIYQVDYNLPQILVQPHINSILKPRIFLVQKNNHLTYQNIAIKYNMGFISLARVPLRQCAPLVRKCGKRDVIICYYGQTDQKLICQDMYWIEKYLGQLRYLGIYEPEEIEIKDKLLKLERPPEPVKAKPAEGQQQKEEQPPAEEEQGKPKKVFDIYSHEWTDPVNHKNLSQWYFKLKKNIKTKNSDAKTCYSTFHQILSALNKDKSCNFYQIIK